MTRQRVKPELIDAVRRCALRGMSKAATAVELGVKSRNTIVGIAYRNKIKFNGKQPKREPKSRAINPRHAPRKPTVRRTVPIIRSMVSTLTETSAKTVSVKPPGVRCSWVGCTCDAELGDMFCYGHGRKGLMA